MDPATWVALISAIIGGASTLSNNPKVSQQVPVGSQGGPQGGTGAPTWSHGGNGPVPKGNNIGASGMPIIDMEKLMPPAQKVAPVQQPEPVQIQGAAAKRMPEYSVGDVLGGISSGMAAAAPLLGSLFAPNNQDKRMIPVSGGPQGQMVQGLNLPQRVSLGEILSLIPQVR
jgi:hypothetical protein